MPAGAEADLIHHDDVRLRHLNDRKSNGRAGSGPGGVAELLRR